MKIDIEVQGLTLTEALRGYVQRRLHNTLGWYADRIERIALVLEEIKGAPQGVDYKSRIRVEVARLPALVIEESGAYLYLAVDRAAGRAGRKLARTIYSARDPVPSDREYALTPELSIAPRFREWIACRSGS
jgi:ribosome-associated translation inhibitor RaiA